MIAQVYPMVKLPRKFTYFDYELPPGLNVHVGDLVRIPLRGREVLGIVASTTATTEQPHKLVTLKEVVTRNYLSAADLERYEQIAHYVVQSVSNILCAAFTSPYYGGQPPFVHASQQPSISAADIPVLESALGKIERERQVCLSGDSDTGLALAYAFRRKHAGQMLFLLPRERDAEMLMKYVNLGDNVCLLHGKTTPKDRAKIIEGWRTGTVRTLIGTRQASLLPAKQLTALFVLESGNSEYASSRRNPRFDARETAKLLAKSHQALMVFYDSLPRLEELSQFPLITTHPDKDSAAVIDLRAKTEKTPDFMLSETLLEGIKTALQSHKKVLLCLNRKGVAQRLQCAACAHIPVCGTCGHLPVIRHDDLVCPNCQTEMWIPELCPACGQKKIGLRGIGGAKIETSIQSLFPDISVGRIEKGSITNPNADLIIATEYFFSSYLEPFTKYNFGLVADLAADISLQAGDFRGAEDTARKLWRCIGLARREQAKVIFQTCVPDLLRPMLDLQFFIDHELELRQRYNLPPFAKHLTLQGAASDLPPALTPHFQNRGEALEAFVPELPPTLTDLSDKLKLTVDGLYTPYGYHHESPPQPG